MPPAEISCRLRQAARKRLEASPRSRLRSVSDDYLRRTLAVDGLKALGRQQADERLLEHLRARQTPAFFPGARLSSADRSSFADALEAPESAAARARRLLDGCFDLLGYTGLRFDHPDGGRRWNYDPVNGVEAPGGSSWAIDYLNPAVAGDTKIIWELNRFQFAFDLARAWQATGDEAFAEGYFRLFDDWCAKNPPGCGINWCSSLELAFRCISWIWAHHMLIDSASYTPAHAWKLLRQLVIHGRRLAAWLSYYFAPNTHLLGEALGLFYIGTFLPELPEAAAWRNIGSQVLIGESQKQIRPDGGYFEQSTYYHRYALDFFQQFIILCDINGAALPADFRARIEQMAHFAMHAMRPDGSLPIIGDDDGGKALQLERTNATDIRGALATAAVIFDRHDFRHAAGRLGEETLRLLGPDGAAAFYAMPPEEPEGTSACFPDTGWFFLRDGWQPDADYAAFDCGPQGIGASGHGHADMLALEVTVGGRPVVVDPGTFVYTVSRQWRDYFRGTAAHSTANVDRLDQAVPAGVFKWERLPEFELTASHLGARVDFADGRHTGYARLDDPVVHRRRILYIKRSYWLVVDTFDAAAEHDYEITFSLTPGEVSLDPETGIAVTRHPSGPNLAIVPAAGGPPGLRAELVAGSENPPRGWFSPVYGVRLQAPALAFRFRASGPQQAAFVLYPLRSAQASAPSVRMLDAEPLEGSAADPAAVAIQLETPAHRDMLVLSGRPDAPLRCQALEAHAEAAYVRCDSGGHPLNALLVNGTRVTLDGCNLLAFDSPQPEASTPPIA